MPSPADLLRSARERHGLSQAGLARRAGTTPRQIRRIEQGEISPTVRTLERLLAVLGEQLELTSHPGPLDNRSDAELRADLNERSAAERVGEAAALSRMLTTVAATRSER